MYSPIHKIATYKSPNKYLSARVSFPATRRDYLNQAFHTSLTCRAQPLPDWNLSTSHHWASPPPHPQPWTAPVPGKTDDFTPPSRLVPPFRSSRFRNGPDFTNQLKQAAKMLPARDETRVSDAELQKLSASADDQHFDDVFAGEVAPDLDLENLKMEELDVIKDWVDADYAPPDENISWDEALNISLPTPPPMDEFPDFFAALDYLPKKGENTLPAFSLTVESAKSPVDHSILMKDVSVAMALAADGYPPDGNTRFDWRTRALGQLRRPLPSHLRPRNRQWMYAKQPRRYQPVVSKLSNGHPLLLALQRYRRHFSQLLEAEFQEEIRLFNQRLEEWSTEKLVKAGYTLVKVRGHEVSRRQNSKGEGSFIYSFTRGKGGMIDAAKFT